MENKDKRTKKPVILISVAAVAVIAILLLALNIDKISAQFGDSQENGEEQLPIIKAACSDFPYPPLHYYEDSDEMVGFDVDLANEAASIMGVKIEFVPVRWSENLEALESGDVDILWGGLERASLDESKVKFTKSYLRSDIVLLMPEDRSYEKLEDLQGLNVCALNFTPAFSYLQVYNRDVIKSKSSFTPPDYRELLGSLSSGEYDCMITDTSFAGFYMKLESAPLKMSSTILGSNYAAAVRADDSELFDRLQSALDELEADGTIEALKEKWMAE